MENQEQYWVFDKFTNFNIYFQRVKVLCIFVSLKYIINLYFCLAGSHIGDLGNIYANDNGEAIIDIGLESRGLSESHASLFDDQFSIVNLTLVIHEG